MKSRRNLIVVSVGIVSVLLLIGVATAEESTILNGIIEKGSAMGGASETPASRVKNETTNGNDYIFVANDKKTWAVSNVPAQVLEQYANASVDVYGKVDWQTRSIEVQRITNEGKLLWCQRDMIQNDNAIYPVAGVPDQCS